MSETPKPMAAQTIWCLGMYASASTWLFNVVRQVVLSAQEEKVQVAFVSGKEKNLAFGGPGVVTIVKSHEIKNEARIVDVINNSRKILITIRDPRDAVVSLMQAHGYEFGQALGFIEQSTALCLSFAKDYRAKLFQYETGFFEDSDTVRTIAEHLGYTLDEDVIRAIHGSLTRSEVEKHIQKMPKMQGILKSEENGDLLDAKTQWHSHHAGRNGEIGKWKRLLDARQVEQVERRIDYSLWGHI